MSRAASVRRCGMKDAREQCLALRSARREPVPGRSNVCATAVSPDGYAEGVYGGQTLSSLIPRRLGRGGSRGAVRFRESGSRGPPRFEPSTRGSFREKVDYSNLNRRLDRMPVYGPDLEETGGCDSGLYAPQAPGNSHCIPTSSSDSCPERGTTPSGLGGVLEVSLAEATRRRSTPSSESPVVAATV